MVNSLPKISSLMPDKFVIKQPCYFFVVWLQKEDSKINTDLLQVNSPRSSPSTNSVQRI